jgi:hypothetical protein
MIQATGKIRGGTDLNSRQKDTKKGCTKFCQIILIFRDREFCQKSRIFNQISQY